ERTINHVGCLSVGRRGVGQCGRTHALAIANGSLLMFFLISCALLDHVHSGWARQVHVRRFVAGPSSPASPSPPPLPYSLSLKARLRIRLRPRARLSLCIARPGPGSGVGIMGTPGAGKTTTPMTRRLYFLDRH